MTLDIYDTDFLNLLAITFSTLNTRIEFLEDKLLENREHQKEDIEICYGKNGWVYSRMFEFLKIIIPKYLCDFNGGRFRSIG